MMLLGTLGRSGPEEEWSTLKNSVVSFFKNSQTPGHNLCSELLPGVGAEAECLESKKKF